MARRLFRGRAFSENGWPYVDQGSCRWVQVAANASIQIQDGPPAAIMGAFARDYDEFVEPIFDADSASWTQDNSVDTSNHPGGTAMDLRWNSHPFQKRGTFTPAQRATIQELLDFYEGMIFWAGVDWSAGGWGSPIDEMHWQMGYGTYDQKADAPVRKVYDFIARKIRADGRSTFRRGNAPVGAAQILAAATGLPYAHAVEILPAVSAGLRESEATTPLRIAMWLAQVGHENGGFVYTEEIASGAAYEGRCSDLGNCQPGDGVRFKGRSWIQITGRHNYTEFSKWAYAFGLVDSRTYFVDHPTELADLRWAGIGAAWYWTVARPMNDLTDAGDAARWGDYRGFAAVTAAINGGTTGIDDRRARFNRALAQGDALLTILTGEEDGFLSALTADEQRKLYDEIMKKGPSRSFAAPDQKLIETLLGFIYNTDGNVWTITLTLAYLFDVGYAVAAIERLARDGVHPDSWAFAQVDEKGERWLAEFGQEYARGLVTFKKKLNDLLAPYGKR